MGFFDSVKSIAGEVGNKAKAVAKTGSENVKKATDKAKIKKDISTAEAEINKIYVEIGKQYVEELKVTPNEAYTEKVDAIAAFEKQIEESKKALSELEDKVACTNCGAYVSKDSKFCDKCGTKIEIPESVAEETVAEEVAEEVTTEEVTAEPVEVEIVETPEEDQ